MAALPFRLLSDSERDAVVNSLRTPCMEWGSNWFGAQFAMKLSIKSDASVQWDGGRWFSAGNTADGWLAWSLEPTACKEMLAAMFASSLAISSKTTPLVKALVQESVANLFSRIITHAGSDFHYQVNSGDTEDMQSFRSGYGSGALQLELVGDSFRQHLVIGGDVVEHLYQANTKKPPLSASPVLVNRENTLGKHLTRLQVIAGVAKITLQDLATMQVGDVIRLQASIKDSFSVQSSDTHQILARAHLGILDGNKAIQLIE